MNAAEAAGFAKYMERRFVGRSIEDIKLLPIRVGNAWILHVVRLEVKDEQVLPGQIPDFEGMEARL